MNTEWMFAWCSLAAPSFKVGDSKIPAELLTTFIDTKCNTIVIDPISKKKRIARVYKPRQQQAMYSVAYCEVSPGVEMAFIFPEALESGNCGPICKWDVSKQKWLV